MNENGKQDYQRQQDHARRITEIALRGTALLWDLQADAARSLLETQARAATLFGAPDFTPVFQRGEGGTRGVFSTTMDQALQSMRQINDTATEVQWQLTRVAEQQSAGIADRIQESMEQLGRRSQQGLDEIRRLAEEEANEVEQAAREQRARAGNGGERDPRMTAQGEKRPEAEARNAGTSAQRREGQRHTS